MKPSNKILWKCLPAMIALLQFSFQGRMYSQASCLNLNLQFGPHVVGFKVIHQYDYSRTYKPLYDVEGNLETGERARPLQTCIWYPASSKGNAERMLLREYAYLLATEENFAELTEDLKENALRRVFRFYGVGREKVTSELNSITNAIMNAPPAEGRFPLVVYGPSWNAPAWENSVLCEYLASHGYVVAASPCMGVTTRYMGSSTDSADDLIYLETQARDIEFVIGAMHDFPTADMTQIAVAGFSWGGTSNVLVALRNSRISAAVCLDGYIRHGYDELFKNSPYDKSAKKFNVPFLFLAQKDLPADTMIAYKLNRPFTFFDSLKFSDAYWATFLKLSHHDFGSSFIRFLDRESKSSDPRSVYYRATLDDANESYRLVCLYTLNFLGGYLKGDKKGVEYLKNKPEQNRISQGVLSIRSKTALRIPNSLREFAHMLRQNGFEKAFQIYSEIRKEDPGFTFAENEVNSWGYTLLQMNRIKDAIEVFRFNTQLYPTAFNTYDSLGDAYMTNGDLELAIKNYEKSIELNANNTNAIRVLKRLKDERK